MIFVYWHFLAGAVEGISIFIFAAFSLFITESYKVFLFFQITEFTAAQKKMCVCVCQHNLSMQKRINTCSTRADCDKVLSVGPYFKKHHALKYLRTLCRYA